MILVFFLLFSFGCEKKKETWEEISWEDFVLKDHLPPFLNAKGDLGTNLENALSLTIKNVKEEQYNNYKELCREFGYQIELEETDTFFDAFNEEGYHVRLVYSEEELYLHLDAKEEMEEITWEEGLRMKIPKPNSLLGHIYFDNETTFIIHIGNMTLEDFMEYKEKCKEIGFTNVSLEDEKIFSATNEKEEQIHLLYLGWNQVEISLKGTIEEEKEEEELETDSLEFDYAYCGISSLAASYQETFLFDTKKKKVIEVSTFAFKGNKSASYYGPYDYTGNLEEEFQILQNTYRVEDQKMKEFYQDGTESEYHYSKCSVERALTYLEKTKYYEENN